MRSARLADSTRKFHPGQTPLWGWNCRLRRRRAGSIDYLLRKFGNNIGFRELSAVIIAVAGFVCILGCVDDYYRLKPRLKLVLQATAVVPVVLTGFHMRSVVLFGEALDLGWVGIPLTVVWLLGCINAINLLDGMDGLASVVGMATAITLGVIASCTGNQHVTIAALVLAGSLADFSSTIAPRRAFSSATRGVWSLAWSWGFWAFRVR